MNMTRKPVTKVQTKLMATLFWPTWLAISPMVRPFALGFLSVIGSATGTSETLPVIPPSGSPLARQPGARRQAEESRRQAEESRRAGGRQAPGPSREARDTKTERGASV